MAGINKLCFLIFLGLFSLTSSFKVSPSKTKLSQRLIQNEHQDFSEEENMSVLNLCNKKTHLRTQKGLDSHFLMVSHFCMAGYRYKLR